MSGRKATRRPSIEPSGTSTLESTEAKPTPPCAASTPITLELHAADVDRLTHGPQGREAEVARHGVAEHRHRQAAARVEWLKKVPASTVRWSIATIWGKVPLIVSVALVEPSATVALVLTEVTVDLTPGVASMAATSPALRGTALDTNGLSSTVIVSVPKALKRFSTARVEPPPIEVRATTAAMPMTMPRMVSTARSGLARRLAEAMRSDSRTTIIGRPNDAPPEDEPPLDRRMNAAAAQAAEAAAGRRRCCVELVAELVYVPVTTTSPAVRPLVIWVSDEVAMPVVTWRYVGVPFIITRTNDADELPLTALVGTTSTLLRLAIVTVSEPVMPDLASDGRLCGARSTVYSTVLDELPDGARRGGLARRSR